MLAIIPAAQTKARRPERSGPERDGHSPQDRNEIFLTPWLLPMRGGHGHVMRRAHG